MQAKGPVEIQGIDEDRLIYWPIVTAVASPLALVLAWADLFPGSLLLVPVIFLFWVAMSIRAAFKCATWFQQHAWRRFYSTLSLPVTALAAVLCSASLACRTYGWRLRASLRPISSL